MNLKECIMYFVYYTVHFQFNVAFKSKINAEFLLSACFSEIRGKMFTAP